MPLSDKAQAYAVAISGTLMAIGAVTIPTEISTGFPVIGAAFFVAGVVGLAIKEGIGSSGSSTLPSLPNGFNLTAAKGLGFAVFENSAGDVILLQGGVYTDVYGNKLPQQVLPSGYTSL